MHHCHQLPRGVPRALLAGWITAVAYACTLMYAAMPTTPVSTPPNNATVRRRMELWSAIDRGADPCQSFYAYACGNYAVAVGPSAFDRAAATARAAFDDSMCADIVLVDRVETTVGNRTAAELHARLEEGWVTRDSYLDVGVADNGTYTVLFGNGTTEVECWPACDGLAKLLATATPEDPLYGPLLPRSCREAVTNLQPSRLSRWDPAILESNPFMRSMSDAVPGVVVNLGYGDPEVPDVASGPVDAMVSSRTAAMRALIGTQVNQTRWPVSPTWINAAYFPNRKAVFVPEAMFVPPFYSPEYPEHINAAGAGFIIAHEVGHAIDHQTPNKTLEATLIARLRATARPPNIMLVNDTVSEAIADFYALERVLECEAPDDEIILQTAQLWCQGATQFSADPHPPGHARVNVTFAAVGVLERVYGCPPLNERRLL